MKNLFSLLSVLFFSSVVFSQESMTFRAKVDNRNGDILFIKNNRIIVQEIKIDDKGEFKATFPIKEGLYQLFDGAEYTQLFLKNGYDLNMTLDAKAFDQTIKFEGKGAAENNYLAQETLLDSKFDFDTLLALDDTNYTKAVEDKRTTDFARMDKAKLDPNFVELHKKTILATLMEINQYHAQISANRKLNNTKAPNFDYENYAGGKTSLESLKGKYVYIDVWATWCGPCRAELPFLKEIEKDYGSKNIAFVSISVDVDKDHEKWKTFVQEKELEGIQLFADKNWLSDFIKAFGINSIPRFILIDPTGMVVDADAARPSNPKLRAQFDQLLKSKK